MSINATRMSFGKESLTAVHQRHGWHRLRSLAMMKRGQRLLYKGSPFTPSNVKRFTWRAHASERPGSEARTVSLGLAH
jgi:hypothetical protein